MVIVVTGTSTQKEGENFMSNQNTKRKISRRRPETKGRDAGQKGEVFSQRNISSSKHGQGGVPHQQEEKAAEAEKEGASKGRAFASTDIVYDGNEKETGIPSEELVNVTPEEDRPHTFYDEDYHPAVAYRYTREHGPVSFKELAQILGVDPTTTAKWYYTHSKFYANYWKGADDWTQEQAEASLRELITGGNYKEKVVTTKYETKFDEEGTPYSVKTQETTVKDRKARPDYKAVMAFLQARSPERWPQLSGEVKHQHSHQHRHEMEHEVSKNLQNMSDAELNEAKKLIGRVTGESSSTDRN